MAAFDFPNNPSNNQTYTANGIKFIWNGSVWKKDATSGVKGEKGQKGEQGDKGQKGQKGIIGDVNKGQKGEIGPEGGDGGIGDKGSVGNKGEKGEQGIKGDIIAGTFNVPFFSISFKRWTPVVVSSDKPKISSNIFGYFS